MASLSRDQRKALESTVIEARKTAEAGARKALDQLAVSHHEAWGTMAPPERALRARLRARGKQLGDARDERRGTQAIDKLALECAYEHWHRMLFARFLAECDVLVEPTSGVPISIDECRELAREQGTDWLALACSFAQRMLPQIFRTDDPVLEVRLPLEYRHGLEDLLGDLPTDVFLAEDSLGWVYQFWQSDQKDIVNQSERKIGAEELPAVTQLFTEDYMVSFLLHNTLGAWWAGKLLAAQPELARTCGTEDDLRRKCAALGVDWTYLRFVQENGRWRPAAGTFQHWPKAAKDLTVLDPCMGSGHFLVFALPILAAMRMAEEGSSCQESIIAVLRDNLFGLEIDQRCTQLAAFYLALAAWRLGGFRALPALNLACAGIGINAREDDWVRLAGSDHRAHAAMRQLYALFRQAPLLGSLVDPTRLVGELFVSTFGEVAPLLAQAVSLERSGDDSRDELAVAARGLVTAAQFLVRRFTLVVTNVPYLGRGDQTPQLAEFCEHNHDSAKADLATCFVQRSTRFACDGGSVAVVTPRNWMFLKSYERFRESLLRESSLEFIVPLGARAFETIGGEVVNVVLLGFERARPSEEHLFFSTDAADFKSPPEKAAAIRSGIGRLLSQRGQARNPDARLTLEVRDTLPPLSRWATSFLGLGTGDYSRYGRQFWELPGPTQGWTYQQGSLEETALWGGREHVVAWDSQINRVRGMTQSDREQIHNQDQSGQQAWGRRGVAVSLSQELRCTLYSGEQHDKSVAALISESGDIIPALWCFLTSAEFATKVHELDRKVIVANGTLVKVSFDAERWRAEAAARFPDGLPAPSSDDPAQWLFDGNPSNCRSPLHAAVARLVGYDWPRQRGASFPDAPALGSDGMEASQDEDGIVCLPPLKGKPAAADRLRALLAHIYGAEWSPARMNAVLAQVGANSTSLDHWLRDSFFEQHSDVFAQRPFVLHIWDGTREGFAALVNYHKLAGGAGESRRTLEKLIFTYLGDWTQRQREHQRAGVEGADALVASAEHLRKQLEKILEGEPPYDIFARWKPLHLQPVGWEPDPNDGVRVNIRPFMTAKPLNARGKSACILRVPPRISWEKDRGKDTSRPVDEYPWLWGSDGKAQDFTGGNTFDGNRWNDLHYTRDAKLAARRKAGRP